MGRHFFMNKYLIVFVTILLFSPLAGARGVYISSKDFVEGAFSGAENAAVKSNLKVVRLTPEAQREIKQIIGQSYPAKRIRYWKQGTRSAWIIDQIGKTEPITVGVVVEQGKILQLKILVFRESRGSEVRHSFFTDQFLGLNLSPGNKLGDHVDGITGATLSVIAVKKVARLALYLDQFASSVESKSVGLTKPSR
jgi:hypothetical protein